MRSWCRSCIHDHGPGPPTASLFREGWGIVDAAMGLFDRIFKGKEKGGASLTEEDPTAVVWVAGAAVAAMTAAGEQEDATAVVAVADAAVAATASTGVSVLEAVIVRFAYGGRELGPLFELQHRLEVVVEEGRLGAVDACEVAMDGREGVLTLYGPDADGLFAAARPVLEGAGFLKGARVVVRYGGAGDGAREKEVVIGG
jgi:hypothetical protein